MSVASAAAGGVVIDARPGGGPGPQMDAVIVSPASRANQQAAAPAHAYVVQPGDSLSAIAAAQGADPQVLVRLNSLANPDALLAGQALVLPGKPSVAPSLLEDSPIDRVQFWPWPPAQGQTIVLWLQARDAMTVSLSFEERTQELDLRAGRVETFLPVSALAEPGDSLLELRTARGSVRLPLPVQAGEFPTYHISQSTGGGILDEANRVREEAGRIRALFAVVSPQPWPARARFRVPYEGELVRTAPFGQRRTYGNSTAVTAHEGQDYSAPPGIPVYAPAPATVTLAETLFVRGNAVVLDHGDGVFTGYWHLSEVSVEAGAQVETGQLIGKVGSTGLSTGAHLHWEMRVAGVAVDPEQWVAP